MHVTAFALKRFAFLLLYLISSSVTSLFEHDENQWISTYSCLDISALRKFQAISFSFQL